MLAALPMDLLAALLVAALEEVLVVPLLAPGDGQFRARLEDLWVVRPVVTLVPPAPAPARLKAPALLVALLAARLAATRVPLVLLPPLARPKALALLAALPAARPAVTRVPLVLVPPPARPKAPALALAVSASAAALLAAAAPLPLPPPLPPPAPVRAPQPVPLRLDRALTMVRIATRPAPMRLLVTTATTTARTLVRVATRPRAAMTPRAATVMSEGLKRQYLSCCPPVLV